MLHNYLPVMWGCHTLSTPCGTPPPRRPVMPRCLQVINPKALNKWGTPRGYKLELVGTISQLFPTEWVAMPGFCK